MRTLSIIIVFNTIICAANFGDAFMQIGTSPRAISLGQATVAIPRFSGGYLMNPAAIGNIEGTLISLMAADQFSLANYYSASFMKALSDEWFGSLNFLMLQVSAIPIHPDLRKIYSVETRRDTIRYLSNNGNNFFDDNESAFIMTFTRSPEIQVDLGWMFTKFNIHAPIGINIKAIRKRFYNFEGYGLGADIGTMIVVKLSDIFAYDWMGEFTVGMSYRDVFGTIIYWNSKHEDQIPSTLVLGINYQQPIHILPLNILITRQSSSRNYKKVFQGLEISASDRIFVRIGDNNGQLQGGIGIKYPLFGKKVSVDYSFSNHVLGNSHRVGGSIAF